MLLIVNSVQYHVYHVKELMINVYYVQEILEIHQLVTACNIIFDEYFFRCLNGYYDI